MAARLLVWLYVACALALVSAQILPLQVTVDVGTAVSESGVTQVQPELLGLTAYGGLPNATWIEGSDITILGLALSTQQFFLPDQPPNGTKSWTVGAIEAHFAQPDVIASLKGCPLAKELEQLKLAGVLPHIYIVSIVPGQALGPNCTHVSDDCVPTNATVWGVAAREFLKVMRQVYPAISRAHLLNEPNAHWWKIDHVGTNVPFNGSDYAKFFNEAAAAIHADMPSLSLGGPVTWCPPSGSSAVPNENQFFDYAGSLIDTVQEGQVDYFDFHSYGDDADYLLSEVFLVKGYSKAQMARASASDRTRIALARRAKHRPGFPWLRSAVTENSVQFFHPQQWLQRDLHFQQRTMLLAAVALRFAANPDKVYARHIFNYRDPGDGYERVEGTGPGSGPMAVTPEKQLMQILRPMAGGTRVLVNVSGCMVSPCNDMLVEAVLVNSSAPCGAGGAAGRTLVVAMLNQGTDSQTLVLGATSVTDGWQCDSTVGYVLDQTSFRPLSPVPKPGSGPFVAPPRSLTVVQYRYCGGSDAAHSPQPAAPLAPAAELLREELFCDVFMAQVPAATAGASGMALSCSATLPPTPGDAMLRQWRLRTAFKGVCNASVWSVHVEDPDGCICAGMTSFTLSLGAPGSYTDGLIDCPQAKPRATQCVVQVSLSMVGAAGSGSGAERGHGAQGQLIKLKASRDVVDAQAAPRPCWLKALAVVRQSVTKI